MLTYHSCLFIGLGRAYRLGWEILKLSYGRQFTKGWDHFYGRSFGLKTPCKFDNRRRARLDEMVKKWDREKFIFHAIIPALYPVC